MDLTDLFVQVFCNLFVNACLHASGLSYVRVRGYGPRISAV
jgi:hypothetical protein